MNMWVNIEYLTWGSTEYLERVNAEYLDPLPVITANRTTSVLTPPDTPPLCLIAGYFRLNNRESDYICTSIRCLV